MDSKAMCKIDDGPILYRCMVIKTSDDFKDRGISCPNCFIQRGKFDTPFLPCKGCRNRIEEEVNWMCFEEDRDYTTEDYEHFVSTHSEYFSMSDIENDWPMIDFNSLKAGDRVVVKTFEGKCTSCYEHHFPCLLCNRNLRDKYFASSLSFCIMGQNEYASKFYFGPRGLAPRLLPSRMERKTVSRLVRSEACIDLPSLVS